MSSRYNIRENDPAVEYNIVLLFFAHDLVCNYARTRLIGFREYNGRKNNYVPNILFLDLLNSLPVVLLSGGYGQLSFFGCSSFKDRCKSSCSRSNFMIFSASSFISSLVLVSFLNNTLICSSNSRRSLFNSSRLFIDPFPCNGADGTNQAGSFFFVKKLRISSFD